LEEVCLTKEALGWPLTPTFHIPEEALEHFRKAVTRGSDAQADWELRFESFAKEHPDLAAEFQRVIHSSSRKGGTAICQYSPQRTVAGNPRRFRKTIAVLGSQLPELMGGSADLAPSTHTTIDGAGNFEPENGRDATCTSASGKMPWAPF